MKRRWVSTVVLIVILLFLMAAAGLIYAQQPTLQEASAQAVPMGTAFTYQGQLKKGSGPLNGTCKMDFRLYDAPADGSQVGSPIVTDVVVKGGRFTASLDFGSDVFNGEARWLGIQIKCHGDAGYTDLGRQALTAVPYALYALKAAGYKNVIVVAKRGGNFDSIQAALDSIDDNSEHNRYLVWVGPGTYTETVTMKEYVDIEGAGERLTTITYGGSAAQNTGTVVGASNAELRFLTVYNAGGNNYATAIYNSGASPHLTHVTAIASDGSTTTCGVYNTASASPTMMHVTASGSGGHWCAGVLNYYASPTMTDVIASCSEGYDNYGVNNQFSDTTMVNVIASASGGAWGRGVFNLECSPTLINVIASSTGSADNIGVNNGRASPTMTNVTASVSGGANNYGMYNNNSFPTVQNSTFNAGGDTGNRYGIYNDNTPSTVTVSNCQITGSTNAIYHQVGSTTRVGGSLLSGGPVAGTGIVTCAGVYDENFAFYASTCP